MRVNDFIFNAEIEEVLEELRRQLALNGIPYLQKEPKRSGDHVQVQCPYHGNGQERKPSAGIRREDGLFHCFACNEVHSLQEVISFCFGKHEDIAGMWGWKWLLRNFAVVQVEERKDVTLDFYRGNKHIDGDSGANYITEEELDEYRYIHPYMYKRKLTDDIIELFDVGYDKKTACITFPIRDKEGHCLFVARRSVHTKWFNYPAGAEKPVYGLYELSELAKMHGGKWENEIVICESMIDALTVWSYGKYAVALNGLGNELQFKQLRKMPCRKYILATDNDDAGQKARARLRKQLTNKIVTEYVLPEGKKDINELSKDEFDALQEVF